MMIIAGTLLSVSVKDDPKNYTMEWVGWLPHVARVPESEKLKTQ
jgi:hypothetical protein